MKTRCIPYALLLCLFFSLPIAAAGKAVTFKEGGKGSLTINNQASFDVIIYAGKVVNNNVLGGIRAGKSRTFDLTTLKLPSKNGAFLVRAAAFETYSKKKARVTEDDVLYTGLVVYDLNKPGDTTDLNIHKDIDQNTWFSVSNESQFVLELRAGRPDGELITSLPPLQENKRVFLKPLSSGMPHEIYAAYVYAGAQSNGVKTSTVDADRQRVMPSGFDGGVRRMVFHGPKDISALRPPAVSYFRLVNDTYEDILFMDGNTRLTDQQGLQRAAAGRTATFNGEKRHD